ncbi:hypothetical protein PS3A_37540 [Pseudomonas sp. 3A(2025)]
MPWGPILDEPRIRASFAALEHHQKTVVIAACLYRQLRLIEAFDRCYAQQASQMFIRALDAALANDRDARQRVSEEVSHCIPDTEVYSEQEGSYAQNLLIALSYFLDFVHSKDAGALDNSTRMLLENIDLINYEADEQYDEDSVFAHEVSVFLRLIDAVQRLSIERCRDVQGVAQLAQPHRV